MLITCKIFYMKSYKQLFNEWAQKTDLLHEMTDAERNDVQQHLLAMYNDIKSVCKQYNLTVVLGGGSCLGAIRHKGLIPWDDDLDLNMPRKDYNQLIELLKQGILGDKYEFRYPDGKMYSRTAFLKIYLKNTIYEDIFGNNDVYPEGLFIDIFPIEGVPSSKLWRTIKGCIANALRLISNCVIESEFNSQTIKQTIADSPQLLAVINKRRFIGKCFSFLSSRKWLFLFDRLVADERITSIVTVPTGRNLYNGEIIESCKLFPVVEVPFENMTADVYQDYASYLTMLYGDYMKIPPVEKRERHFIKNIKL